MSSRAVRVFIQARMSSRRFPGKVLVPLAGRPMIDHVLERCAAAFGKDSVVLATSEDPSDDALAARVRSQDYALFRGDLADLVRRFQDCLRAHPCEWFVRISGDSPLIDPGLVSRITARRAPQYDLVTNVQTRTFPPGQSVEVVRAECFARIDSAALSAEEREHATQVFYRSPGVYRICSVLARAPGLERQSFTVDTAEDLRAVEALIQAGAVPTFEGAL
jgi:spore coat polysaccharide biosynthesis protein SpsF